MLLDMSKDTPAARNPEFMNLDMVSLYIFTEGRILPIMKAAIVSMKTAGNLIPFKLLSSKIYRRHAFMYSAVVTWRKDRTFSWSSSCFCKRDSSWRRPSAINVSFSSSVLGDGLTTMKETSQECLESYWLVRKPSIEDRSPFERDRYRFVQSSSSTLDSSERHS